MYAYIDELKSIEKAAAKFGVKILAFPRRPVVYELSLCELTSRFTTPARSTARRWGSDRL